MAVHKFPGQAHVHADSPHLILEQLAQRFHKLKLHPIGQSAHVMVRLDDVRLTELARRRLNDVRIDGPLRQPSHIRDGMRLLIEDVDERISDDLAFRLGLILAAQLVEEFRLRIHADEIQVQRVGGPKCGLYFRPFVLAQ